MDAIKVSEAEMANAREQARAFDARGEARRGLSEAAPKPKITGYRDLSEAEIALINRVKAKAEEVGELVAEIDNHPLALHPLEIDHRWLAIGKTDLQKGFMAIIRAIARPEGF